MAASHAAAAFSSWSRALSPSMRQLLGASPLNRPNHWLAASTTGLGRRRYASQAQRVADSWEVNVRHGGDFLVGPRPDWWWTGVKPTDAPGLRADGTVAALPHFNLATATRKSMREYFDNAWVMNEILFAGLKGEEPFYRPPYHHLRHPLIFYHGHTATVYVNKLRVAGLLKGAINEYYEQIFEVGVDEMKWDDMSKNDMEWPAVEDVSAYRRDCYNAIVDIIETHPAFDTLATELMDNPFWALALGFEHEKIHLETSSVLMRELPINLVQVPENFPKLSALTAHPGSNPVAGKDYPINEFVSIKGGEVRLGKPHDFPSFGWDNEYGERVYNVKDFEATKYLITNGEMYEFVTSGGYRDERFWSTDGWGWRTFRNAKWPTFWVRTGPSGLHEYKLRSIFQVHDMQWSWPAEVNYHEAQAFAKWKSDKTSATPALRLNTEFEHHRMRDSSTRDMSLGLNRDVIMDPENATAEKLKEKANLNFVYGSPTNVDALPPTSAGVYDVQGNVWEWCEDHFSALKNFQAHPYYDDFSIPCFDGEHNIILGGSFASCGDEASIFARFHFRPHFFQHAGFRLIKPNEDEPALVTSCMDNEGPYVGTHPFRSRTDGGAESKKYEAEETLQQFIHLHYDAGAKPEFLPDTVCKWPTRAAELLVSKAKEFNVPTKRVLDIGCSVGGISFELSKTFDEVMGLDISSSFIDTAKHIKEHSGLTYRVRREGEIYDTFKVQLSDETRPDNVTFRLGDATSLPLDLADFDAVVVANIIDRLSSPKACLGRLSSVVRPGGLLLLTSPFSWKKVFTAKEQWLGGRDEDGVAQHSEQQIKQLLSADWELVHEQNAPFVIREHARKYDLVYTYASVWKRK